MSIELYVTIKDCERTLKKEFLVYEPLTFSEDDAIIKKYVDEAIKEFQGEPEDIKVRAMMVYQ